MLGFKKYMNKLKNSCFFCNVLAYDLNIDISYSVVN